jgi:O-antigen/teichoic acid export membrane protein
LTACGLLIFGSEFLFLFGKKFIYGKLALSILIFGQLVNSAAGIAGTILVMCGLEKKAAIGLLFGVSSNIIMNIIFIPIWKINGAALATSASTIIWVSMLAYYVNKSLGINPTVLCFLKNNNDKGM